MSSVFRVTVAILILTVTPQAWAWELSVQAELEHAPTQPSPFTEQQPTIISGPSMSLAVWQGAGINATRLAASGKVLDSDALVLGIGSNTGAGYERIAGAWDGSQFVVVWISSSQQVLLRTVALSGELGPAVEVATGGVLRSPTIACTSTECLVAWWRFEIGVGHGVALARIVDGVVEQTEIPVTTAAGDQHEPAIAWNGDNYLVAWRDIRRSDAGDIYGTFVSSLGVVLDTAGFPISVEDGAERQVALAQGTGSILAVWIDESVIPTRLSGASIDGSGVVGTLPVFPIALPDIPEAPSLAASGSYLLAWTSPSGLHARQISLDGATVSEISGLTTSVPAGQRASVAAFGSEFLLTWTEQLFDHTDVLGLRIQGADIVPLGVLARSPSFQMAPAVAQDSSGLTFVAWIDSQNGGYQVHGARLDSTGASMDGTGVALSPNYANRNGDPRVVAGDGMFLIVWSEKGEGIQGVRVDAAGLVLDASPIPIADLYFNERLEVASSGSSFLVVWEDSRKIYSTRVSESGQVLHDTPIQLSPPTADAHSPTLTWNGSHFLVSWDDWSINALVGMRVGADAVPIEPAQRLFFGKVTNPNIVAGADGFLIAFRASLLGHFDSSLNPVDDFISLGSAATEANWNALAWDGGSYICVYGLGGYAMALRVSASDGEVIDKTRVSESPTRFTWETHSRTAIASNGGGSVVLVSVRRISFDRKVSRDIESHLFVRVGTSLPLGDSCAEGRDCQTGACVDDVCCESSCAGGTCSAGLCVLPTPVNPDAGTDANTETTEKMKSSGGCHVGSTDQGGWVWLLLLLWARPPRRCAGCHQCRRDFPGSATSVENLHTVG